MALTLTLNPKLEPLDTAAQLTQYLDWVDNANIVFTHTANHPAYNINQILMLHQMYTKQHYTS